MLLRHTFAFFVAVSGATAIPSFNSHRYQPNPEDPVTPLLQHQGHQTPLRIWPKVRDTVIETLWGSLKHDRNPFSADRSSTSLSSAPSSLQARYGEDIVLRFSIDDPSQVAALREASNILFLDVWSSTDEWVDIRLAKDVVPSLLGLLPSSLQNAHAPLIHDLAQTIYESYPSSSTRRHDNRRPFSLPLQPSTDTTDMFFRDYQPYSVIVPWMRLMSSMFSTHVQMISIGTSFEGRDIPALRLGSHRTDQQQPSSPRKTIVVVGGAHAREWISTSTVNYVAYSLITSYGKSKPVIQLLEEFDWVFVPTLNPDGYVYTWEEDRLWRKNRQETDLPFCRGLDLDRSWGYEWSGEEARSNPCSESYAGDGPFEAVESKEFAQWAIHETENNNVEFVGYLDLHSYSQQILYPYSFSCLSVPPTLENLEELAMGIAKAIRRSNRELYDVSSACEGLTSSDTKKKNHKPGAAHSMESTGGSPLDWFYHELHVRYAYQIKLRDKGNYGFMLPKENIVPTGKEVYNAALVIGKFLLDKYAGGDAAEIDWDAEFQLAGDRENPLAPETRDNHPDEKDEVPQPEPDDPDDILSGSTEDDFPNETDWDLRRRR